MSVFKVFTLTDGRQLAVSEFGDPNGYPVINCHGGLVGRLDIAWADDAAKKAGVRIISPDRPGIGYSDPQKGRTVLDWADDIQEFADTLKLKKFAVMGWSMGTIYALACAYALKTRVSKVTLIAPCLELSDRSTFSKLNPMDKKFSKLSHKLPPLAWFTYWVMGFTAQHFPKFWANQSAKHFRNSDARIVKKDPVQFAIPTADALRKPSGMIEEYRVFIKPWGLKPEEIKPKVSIWQGTDDQFVPKEWASILAKKLPNAKLHMIPKQGHFIAHGHITEILKFTKNR